MEGCLGFIAILVMLAILGWVIDMIVPGKMPMGLIGGIGAAIVGGLLGGFIFGNFGPAATFSDWTLSFIPALLGGIILGFIVRFIMGRSGRTQL